MLPTTSVGSFPKPPDLLKARSQFARKEISEGALKEKEEAATAFWIDEQERLGIDILVDGEMYRGDMVAYFAEHLRGFQKGGLVRSYGNRYYHKPVVVGEVKWDKPITVDWWKFAQKRTKKPIKGMLTGAYTIMDWSFNEHYPDRKATCFAIAKEIRKEVEALVEAGAKVIQIDEPALSVRPEELKVAIEAMHITTDGIPAYFITHVCYGAFEFVYPKMLEMPVDNFDLEMSNSEMDLLSLLEKHPFTKDFSFGVVDVHSHKIEDKNLVSERIKKALSMLPKEQLWVDPDCGLKTRTVEEAKGKMKSVADGTTDTRGKL